jgi:hypothetical protein
MEALGVALTAFRYALSLKKFRGAPCSVVKKAANARGRLDFLHMKTVLLQRTLLLLSAVEQTHHVRKCNFAAENLP